MMKHTVQDRAKSKRISVNAILTLLLSIVLLLMMNQAIAQGERGVTKPKNGAPRIAGILISDVGNSDGYVSQGKATIPPTQSIYVTVQIFHAKAGLKVQVFLINPSKNIHEHAENVASISGNIAKAFKFNDATGNWPAGTYKVEVKLSTGDTRITTFELKK
ncbi:ABC transporter permease [Legionella sp. PATHC035]|uniref:ABC transporter permease n=1 Tax=Legionella sp. PATHC035 TaxID=2992040 RepID=UPI002243E485|nr:ABC transporter permease [Legionella sp. PATHC035]MCW8408832.1 ABC transporter permease [Legionella sp. PATHC035]